MILCEYEEFFEIKYGHPPKLTRKLAESAASSLPKIPMKKGSSSNNLDKKTSLPPKSNDKKAPNSSNSHNKTIENQNTNEKVIFFCHF